MDFDGHRQLLDEMVANKSCLEIICRHSQGKVIAYRASARIVLTSFVDKAKS